LEPPALVLVVSVDVLGPAGLEPVVKPLSAPPAASSLSGRALRAPQARRIVVAETTRKREDDCSMAACPEYRQTRPS
jgi:hypothetical protein